MKKLVLVFVFVALVIGAQSCKVRTCPTYAKGKAPQTETTNTPAEADKKA